VPKRVQAFLDFHRDNRHVFDWFVRYALEAKRVGRKRIGARLIGERIRWQAFITTNGDDTNGEEFKVSNNQWAYYTRLAIARNESLDGFITMRPLVEEITIEELDRLERSIPCA
jgi:hypothetical protein